MSLTNKEALTRLAAYAPNGQDTQALGDLADWPIDLGGVALALQKGATWQDVSLAFPDLLADIAALDPDADPTIAQNAKLDLRWDVMGPDKLLAPATPPYYLIPSMFQLPSLCHKALAATPRRYTRLQLGSRRPRLAGDHLGHRSPRAYASL